MGNWKHFALTKILTETESEFHFRSGGTLSLLDTSNGKWRRQPPLGETQVTFVHSTSEGLCCYASSLVYHNIEKNESILAIWLF